MPSVSGENNDEDLGTSGRSLYKVMLIGHEGHYQCCLFCRVDQLCVI